jgi:hypothetical protein
VNTIFTVSIYQQSCLCTLLEITMHMGTLHSFTSLKKKIQYSHPKSFKHWLLHYTTKSLKWFLPFRVSKQTLYSFPLYNAHATCHICTIFLAMIMMIISGEWWQSWITLQHHLQPPIPTSLPPTPNNLLTTPNSQTLNLWSTLDVRHQISHPHKMTGTMFYRWKQATF